MREIAWLDDYRLLDRKRQDMQMISRTLTFHHCAGFILGQEESRRIIQAIAGYLNQRDPYWEYQHVDAELVRRVPDGSLDRVWLLAYRANGSCGPHVDLTDEQRVSCPRLRNVRSFSMVLRGGPPFLKFPNSDYQGIALVF